ncbi:MAG TPA: HAD family hydrolase [Thermoleophilaceae bacterium]|nr:HAD family hydrolase [Thermoleophilaceae bacterium]
MGPEGTPQEAVGGPGARAGSRGAAFFDLDKTLMEGASGIHFARAAYRAGIVSRRRLARDLWANVRYRVRGATDQQADAVRERVMSVMAGVPQARLMRLGPEVLAGILPSVYPEMLRVAWGHQDAGRPAYIVTAASQELADLLARVLVLDGAVGTPYEVRDGHYTGRLAGPFTYREGKAEAIRLLAGERGIDLARSYAYSDSESDMPMLRAVGHPVAVNPDPPLARIAREEGWEILRFDKLRRRLRILSVATALALVGGGGGYLAGRLRATGRGVSGARRRAARMGRTLAPTAGVLPWT